jgi:hypothetical protein
MRYFTQTGWFFWPFSADFLFEICLGHLGVGRSTQVFSFQWKIQTSDAIPQR